LPDFAGWQTEYMELSFIIRQLANYPFAGMLPDRKNKTALKLKIDRNNRPKVLV
jgi:hypothetical protein